MATALLLITAGPDEGSSHQLVDELTVGRSLRADIVLNDEAASREHARLRPEGITVVIEDLDSSNGTWVNGERIEIATRLEEGDVVQIGDTTMSLQFGTGEGPTETMTPSEVTVIRPPPDIGGGDTSS